MHRELGRLAIEQKDLPEAVSEIRKGLSIDQGGDAQSAFYLAELLISLQRTNEANALIAQFRRLVGGETPSPETRYLIGLQAFNTGHPELAIRELEAVRDEIGIGLRPKLLDTLGNAYLQWNPKGPQAVEALKAAVDEDPSRIASWITLSRVQARTNPDEAMQTLRNGIARNNGNPHVGPLVSELAQQLMSAAGSRGSKTDEDVQNKAYLAELDKILKEKTDDVITANPQFILFEADRKRLSNSESGLSSAIELLQKGVKEFSNSLELRTALARGLFQAGKIDEALNTLDEAARTIGDDIAIRLLKARFLLLLGKEKGARDALAKFGDKDVENPQDLADLAKAHEENPKVYLSIPQQVSMWESLGMLALERNDLKRARYCFENEFDLSSEVFAPKQHLFDLCSKRGTKLR